MATVETEKRPNWLKLWLAFAVAVLVYRLASGFTEIVLHYLLNAIWFEPLQYLVVWQDRIIIVVGVCAAILAERQQEPYFAQKSKRINVIVAVIVTLVALNPVTLSFHTRPASIEELGIQFRSPPGADSDVKRVDVELRLAEQSAAPGLEEVTHPATGEKIYLYPSPILTNADVEHTRIIVDENGKPCVEMSIRESSRERLTRATQGHMRNLLALLLDGQVVIASTVHTPLSSQVMICTGSYTQEEAEEIAAGILAR